MTDVHINEAKLLLRPTSMLHRSPLSCLSFSSGSTPKFSQFFHIPCRPLLLLLEFFMACEKTMVCARCHMSFSVTQLEPTRVRWNDERVLKDVYTETSIWLLAGSTMTHQTGRQEKMETSMKGNFVPQHRHPPRRHAISLTSISRGDRTHLRHRRSPSRTVPTGSRHFTDSDAIEPIALVHYELNSVAFTLPEVIHRLRDDPLAARSHVAVTPLIFFVVVNATT